MIAYFHVEETVVRAPAPQCYDLVAAVRRHGEWWLAHSAALGPEGVLRVGSRFSLESSGLRWVAEVARLDPYRRVSLHCVDGDLRGPLCWEFEPQRDGTRVRYVHRGVAASSAAAERLLAGDGFRRHAEAIHAEAFAGMRRSLETPAADISGGDLFAAMHSQRAVRRFRTEPISDAILREILAAAVRAPSARNSQPWVFVAVRDAALKTAVRDHYRAAWRQAQAFTAQVDADADIKHRPDYAGMMRGVDRLAEHLDQAPLLMLCGLDTSLLGPMADAQGNIRAPQSAYASIFPAVQNLMLAARGLGIGSTLTTVFQAAEGDLRRLVNLPDHIHIAALVPLGYPHRPFRVTARRPVDEIAFLDRWGTKLPA